MLEERDGHFSNMLRMIEQLYNNNNSTKVVLVVHSLGTVTARCLTSTATRSHSHSVARSLRESRGALLFALGAGAQRQRMDRQVH